MHGNWRFCFRSLKTSTADEKPHSDLRKWQQGRSEGERDHNSPAKGNNFPHQGRNDGEQGV